MSTDNAMGAAETMMLNQHSHEVESLEESCNWKQRSITTRMERHNYNRPTDELLPTQGNVAEPNRMELVDLYGMKCVVRRVEPKYT